jgi:TolA-binding protein
MILSRDRLGPACKEARIDLPRDSIEAERIRLHVQRCTACQAHAAGIEEIRSAIATAERGLDDLSRARIASRLAPELDAIAAKATLPRHGFRVAAWAGASLLLLAVIAGAIAVLAPRSPDLGLTPYFASGSPALTIPLGSSSREISAPEGGVVRAEIGAAGHISLLGPGRALLANDARLVLEGGLLIAEIDHGAIPGFTVEAGEVEVRVVGTIFSVDARDRERITVFVARGAVEIHTRSGGSTRLAAGQRWSGTVEEGAGSVLSEALAAHDRIRPIRGRRSGVVRLFGEPDGSQVNLQNVALGSAPIAVRLPIGEHRFFIESSSRAPSEISVVITEGEVTRARYDLPAIVDTSTRSEAIPEPPTPAPTPLPKQRRKRLAIEPELTAEALYARAEEALRAGDRDRAKDELRSLVRRFPEDALASAALYELARMSESGEARGYLEELLSRRSDRGIEEPARYLLCRSYVDSSSVSAALSCFSAFRRSFPDSAHDHEVLAAIAVLAEKVGGCASALPWLEEYLRSYPTGRFAAQAEARRSACAR